MQFSTHKNTHSFYELLDSGQGEKLERLGQWVLRRPCQVAIWEKTKSEDQWNEMAHATFIRLKGGGGEWKIRDKKLQEKKAWQIQIQDLKVELKLTDFRHLGIFPEHISFWEKLTSQIKNKNIKILNLFGYTGIGSLWLAKYSSSEITHVDASKASIVWAKKNAELSQLSNAAVRWICDDAQKFVEREFRRDKKYDLLMLDPPTFGRGTKNELWKIEDHLFLFLKFLKKILSENFVAVHLSCHTPGITPLVLETMLKIIFTSQNKNLKFQSEEMFLPHRDRQEILPMGSSCIVWNM